MVEISGTLVSEDIFEKKFLCDLQRCKGACCVEGDAGAPLEQNEKAILEEIYPKIKSFLRPEGIIAIESQHPWVTDEQDGEPVTPLVHNKECAYVIFDDKNIAKCGIEYAYNAGVIEWKKPISCHLYPIRVKEYTKFTALNYDRWPICAPACTLGEAMNLRVYQFLKDPIIRKFGAAYYNELETAAEEWVQWYEK